MPYPDERAGLAAIQSIVDGKEFEQFREKLNPPSAHTVLPLPKFLPCPIGKTRTNLVAIDGSRIYDQFPGRLPDTHVGAVSLGVVVINLSKLASLPRLPLSGAVDPRELRSTEKGNSLGAMLPGTNAGTNDGTGPREWFRHVFNKILQSASLGGESFATSLYYLLGEKHEVDQCPNPDCDATGLSMPAPGKEYDCPHCSTTIYTTDGLRIHEQFIENRSAEECHSRVMDTLELLALINGLRGLTKSREGLVAISETAFVLDGQLAAFGTIAVLAHAIQQELQKIQGILQDALPSGKLLVMSGVKSGPFVKHSEELDRGPEPNSRIPINSYWLPDNNYIRENVVAGHSANSKPWGQLTHFGRPLILKTPTGQRLVLNVAQPEFNHTGGVPLTNAPDPSVLGDAVSTAAPLGVGTDQFLALRRAHRWASLPIKTGTSLIHSLVE
ncbi:MAG: hypothetical protein F4X44_00910 [Gammaproteobacteria bacterium]|nr:hypothetical protein [Gammaproteobacteria bacterium]MYD79163.1 hypothetical protein [Gammaproteobacteria bacterium]